MVLIMKKISSFLPQIFSSLSQWLSILLIFHQVIQKYLKYHKFFFPFLIQMLAYLTHLPALFFYFLTQQCKTCWSLLYTEVSSS